MKHLVAFVRLVLLALLFVLTAVFAVLGRVFGHRGAHLALRLGTWMKSILLGMRIKVQGTSQNFPQMIMVNHPSYLDILFVKSLKHPTSLLAAKNFKHWPFVGWLGQAIGAIWIKRHDREAGKKVLQDAALRFQQNLSLMTAPEGRTSGTHDIYPVKPGLFYLALEQKVPITFMTIKYLNPALPYFHSLKQGFVRHFLKHFWAVLGQKRIIAELIISEPQWFPAAKEGMQAFYEFQKEQLQGLLHFEVPVIEEVIGEALTRLDPNILRFKAESIEQLTAE